MFIMCYMKSACLLPCKQYSSPEFFMFAIMKRERKLLFILTCKEREEWLRKENSSNFKTYPGAHNLQLKKHIPTRK